MTKEGLPLAAAQNAVAYTASHWSHQHRYYFPTEKTIHNCSKLTIPAPRLGSSFPTMKKELTSKDVLAIRCPTCGAPPGARCELGTRQPRTEPHRDPRFVLAEHLDSRHSDGT